MHTWWACDQESYEQGSLSNSRSYLHIRIYISTQLESWWRLLWPYQTWFEDTCRDNQTGCTQSHGCDPARCFGSERGDRSTCCQKRGRSHVASGSPPSQSPWSSRCRHHRRNAESGVGSRGCTHHRCRRWGAPPWSCRPWRTWAWCRASLRGTSLGWPWRPVRHSWRCNSPQRGGPESMGCWWGRAKY